MEYIGKVKYRADVPHWAYPVLKENTIYKATDMSTAGFINVELDGKPLSYYTDTADKFEIVEDPEGKLESLFGKKKNKI